MHRLFIGLQPPAVIRIALRAVMADVPAARWQHDDQLHLTLRYIGEVDARVADEVALAMSRVQACIPDVALAGVGRFDRDGRTDTLWVGLRPTEPLAALHKKVDRALVAIGLPPEGRAFVPHITLARLPRSQGAGPAIDAFLARHAALSSEPFVMPHLILYESHLGTGGSAYDIVARWPLG
ncbi:MAG: RNA 2',3'-cyclic phosphodiesterase [Sphingomonas sp.]|uniref:RNA 2',3'-cyclic phosphodiesterase n=1 Tax=Sphingomonas sp. TaxID=28214 RepID=UPI0025E1EE9C|nr:RNA 2',3'-cyclic phosphodiesterase [Sphingomonas sp.]MBX9859665.1 RNA 2',3'-cyclic phosphodiesterase [Sphingomonas sp.]MBY0283102.1 RNA 2',3'-cyclic phosphodiesterase [Sphingomonas sp.]